MKQVAFISRDKIRDFYGLYWCVKNRPEVINLDLAKQILELEALYFKGVDEIAELLERILADSFVSNAFGHIRDKNIKFTQETAQRLVASIPYVG